MQTMAIVMMVAIVLASRTRPSLIAPAISNCNFLLVSNREKGRVLVCLIGKRMRRKQVRGILGETWGWSVHGPGYMNLSYDQYDLNVAFDNEGLVIGKSLNNHPPAGPETIVFRVLGSDSS